MDEKQKAEFKARMVAGKAKKATPVAEPSPKPATEPTAEPVGKDSILSGLILNGNYFKG